MHVYHVTKSQAGEQVGDMDLYVDLGAAMAKAYELSDQHIRRSRRLARAAGRDQRLTVSTLETGAIRWSTEGGHVTWTIERREVR